MSRFAFRQVDYRDLETFLLDGGIFAKNHSPLQKCHQTSYKNLVDRRGTSMFQMPNSKVINDFVAFYLSPISSFTYAIHKGSVPVIDPNGNEIGMSNLGDRAFIVCNIDKVIKNISQCYYSNYALNSQALSPEVFNDFSQIENNINWSLFDDHPMVAEIPEIGYKGVCKFFASNTNIKYQTRKETRMAEFLVPDELPWDLIECIVLPNDRNLSYVQSLVSDHKKETPIYVKPGCFV